MQANSLPVELPGKPFTKMELGVICMRWFEESFFFFLVFIPLLLVLAAACGIFSCDMRDSVP